MSFDNLILWLPLLAFWVWWILSWLGIDKRWFVMPSAPYISRNLYFALPSFLVGSALGLINLSFILADPNAGSNLILVGWVFWGLSFVFAYFEPDWMAPAWYRWLKREHGDIFPFLAEEAHRLGRKEWLKRARTQEDLEQWVEEFRRKFYGPDWPHG